MLSFPLFWVFVGTFAFVWWLNRNKRRKEFRHLKELPGPRGWPLVGVVFQLGKFLHITLNKWTEKYGEIYQMKFGTNVNVVISSPKLAKEMFLVDPNYVGRPHIAGFDLYENERLGLVNSEGELWEVHRRFMLRQLRDFGFGKAAMEGLILEELNELITGFKESEGKPVKDIKKIMTLAVINSLWSVVSSQRFKHDDPKLLKLVQNTDKALADVFETGGLIFFLPLIAKIMPELSGYNKIRRVFDANRSWFEEGVREHKRSFEEGNIRDFIDVYLAEVKKTTDPNSVFYGELAEKQLVAIISDLFFAGSDTTSTTLAWAILFLCKNPETQRKFQEEVASVTGNTRYVSVADRPNMPYTLAVIDEVLRHSSIVPDGVIHRAIEDKEFKGYFIPKDAWIMTNMFHIHHDPKVWGDPETFRPERFIGSDGKYQKHENLMPFQIGRRQCVGETLARDTIFLFLTNIFQRFDISFDPAVPEPTMELQSTFLLNPLPYNIIMKDRLQ